MKIQDPNKDIDYDYAIIWVKPQNENFENPMDPITMMRNALGTEFGGSGIKIDNDQYLQSVKFWSENIIAK